jgi:sec-independent protein translocase protein TatA
MPNIGPVEIIVILVVVILLFGVGRIGKIGGELGKSIREFRKGLEGDEKKAAAADKPADGTASASGETKVS